MAKQKGVAPRESSDGMSIVAAMLVGGVVTVAIGFFLYLWNPFNQTKAVPVPQDTPSVRPKTQASSTPKSNYEFYDLLPDQKITGLPKQAINDGSNTGVSANVTPDVVLNNTAKNKVTSATATTLASSSTASTSNANHLAKPTDNDSPSSQKNRNATGEDGSGVRTYILQINSYTNADDADRRRARVLMAGVDAQIVKKQLPDGLLVYQVISRPMANQVQVAEAQARLQDNGIDSLIVEQRRAH